jgi:hypothetical protein
MIDDVGAATRSVDDRGREMPKKVDDESLKVLIGLRVTPEDARRLDAIEARIPIASRHRIAREALRIGMGVLEEDPLRLLARPKEAISSKAARGGRGGRGVK